MKDFFNIRITVEIKFPICYLKTEWRLGQVQQKLFMELHKKTYEMF